MSRLKVCIVGLGHLGSRHLKVLSELKDLAQITCICDSDPKKTAKLSEQYKIPAFTNYQECIDKVDAAIICVPTSLHFEIAKCFLENGIHTFVEKPITLNVEQADILIDTASKFNRKLQVGHIERFNSAFMAITHFAQDPLFIEVHRLSPFPYRSLDIGVVMDLMIHDIDIILGLNQCPIKSFHAVGVNVLTDFEDIASVRIIFENGCVANLTASRVSDETMRKIRIFLKDSYISLDYVKQEAFIYKKRQNLISKHALPIEKEEPLKKELESFLNCVIKDKRPIISGIEARNALKIALSICEQIHNKS